MGTFSSRTPVLVRERAAGAVDAAVDLGIEMFQKAAEYHRIINDPFRPGPHPGGVLGGQSLPGGEQGKDQDQQPFHHSPSMKTFFTASR